MEFSELEVLSFLVSAALVFVMVPGLALFYGGLVRHKNVIGTMMHSVAAIGVVSVVWVLWGYSLAFSTSVGGLGFVGDLVKFGMIGVAPEEQAFMAFQGMFAIITVALIAGGFAERLSFHPTSSLRRCGLQSSMRRCAIGFGAAAGWAIWGRCWG